MGLPPMMSRVTWCFPSLMVGKVPVASAAAAADSVGNRAAMPAARPAECCKKSRRDEGQWIRREPSGWCGFTGPAFPGRKPPRTWVSIFDGDCKPGRSRQQRFSRQGITPPGMDVAAAGGLAKARTPELAVDTEV